jgi:hypothetical protein
MLEANQPNLIYFRAVLSKHATPGKDNYSAKYSKIQNFVTLHNVSYNFHKGNTEG